MSSLSDRGGSPRWPAEPPRRRPALWLVFMLVLIAHLLAGLIGLGLRLAGEDCPRGSVSAAGIARCR